MKLPECPQCHRLIPEAVLKLHMLSQHERPTSISRPDVAWFPVRTALMGGAAGFVLLWAVLGTRWAFFVAGGFGALVFTGRMFVNLISTQVSHWVFLRGPRVRDFSMAKARVAQGRYEEALALYAKALEEDPKDLTPWLEVGFLCAEHLKDDSQAAEAFAEAAEDATGRVSPMALDQLAATQLRLGQTTAARLSLERLVRQWGAHSLANRARLQLNAWPPSGVSGMDR